MFVAPKDWELLRAADEITGSDAKHGRVIKSWKGVAIEYYSHLSDDERDPEIARRGRASCQSGPYLRALGSVESLNRRNLRSPVALHRTDPDPGPLCDHGCIQCVALPRDRQASGEDAFGHFRAKRGAGPANQLIVDIWGAIHGFAVRLDARQNVGY